MLNQGKKRKLRFFIPIQVEEEIKSWVGGGKAKVRRKGVTQDAG